MFNHVNRSRLIYQLLLVLALPLLILLLLWQTLRRKGDRQFLLQRLGLSTPSTENHPILLHGASVGEIAGLIPLIHQLQTDYPLLITTTTPQGAQIVRQRTANIPIAYLPLDLFWNSRLLLQRVQPRMVVIMETEIWPNLYQQAQHQGIPLVIVNGRISNRTLQTPKWLKNLYKSTLNCCSAILCRSDNDRDGFIALGARPALCSTIGNLKYAATQLQQNLQPLLETRRKYIIAASTRESEEPIIVESWLQTGLQHDYLLVLALRHPQRSQQVQQQLQHYKLAVRSLNQPIIDDTEIVIVDTIGEMPPLLQHSELVVMGGSFVNKGGQNLLEPASLGKATIVGPHMDNFLQETSDLLQHQAIMQVQNSQQLTELLLELLNTPEKRAELAENAIAYVTEQRQQLQSYVTAITKLLPDR